MAETNYIMQLLNGDCEDPKGRILGAAMEEIAMRSVEGARTREIAARAKVNLAAISYYFGGKQGLYLELLREIGETIGIFHAEHLRRAEAIFEAPDSEAALTLLKDMLISRIGGDVCNSVFSSLVLIVAREETLPTEGARMLHRPLGRVHAVCSRLVEIASEGRICGEEASLTCSTLFGQIRVFSSCPGGVKYLNKWTRIGAPEISRIKHIIVRNVESILKRK